VSSRTTDAPVALELDGVLADTRSLWQAWLASAGPVLGVSAEELPADRAAAARELDARGAGNWRDLLARFAEERVAVHVRRDRMIGAALRALASHGVEIGVYSDAPEPLARVALVHVGADRRVSALATGDGAVERLRAELGPETAVITSRGELRSLLERL
jgi:phosphoglycolate phosphatase-like HAD superfamily hydrolase